MNYEVCELVYQFEVSPSLGLDGVSFDSAATQRMLTYDFELDGGYVQSYQITIIVQVAEALGAEERASWNLIVAYPCENLDLITISGQAPLK